MEKTRETREDPRVTRTRNLIRDAFEAMIEEKTFSDITVADIAERATINRATFYAHFEDKYALLEDLVRTRYGADLARFDLRSSTDIASLLETVAMTTLEHVRSKKKCRVDKEFEPQLEPAMQDVLHRFLSPVMSDAAALVVSSAVIGSALQWRASRYKEPADHVVERLVTVLTEGVRYRAPASAARLRTS